MIPEKKTFIGYKARTLKEYCSSPIANAPKHIFFYDKGCFDQIFCWPSFDLEIVIAHIEKRD